MSEVPSAATEPPAESPDNGLEWSVDDREDPQEVTVFAPESPDLTTEWITIEYDAAIPASDWE